MIVDGWIMLDYSHDIPPYIPSDSHKMSVDVMRCQASAQRRGTHRSGGHGSCGGRGQ